MSKMRGEKGMKGWRKKGVECELQAAVFSSGELGACDAPSHSFPFSRIAFMP